MRVSFSYTTYSQIGEDEFRGHIVLKVVPCGLGVMCGLAAARSPRVALRFYGAEDSEACGGFPGGGWYLAFGGPPSLCVDQVRTFLRQTTL